MNLANYRFSPSHEWCNKEASGLVAERLGLTGGIWSAIGSAAGNFTALGYLVVGIFVASWLVSFAIYRTMGYNKIRSV